MAFSGCLRQDLGTRFTVACEQVAGSQDIHVLVLHQRRDELLTVMADPQWLTTVTDERTPAVRVEYKHLVVAVRNFFRRPDALPAHTFVWPGTQETREDLRRTLTPRRPSKAPPLKAPL